MLRTSLTVLAISLITACSKPIAAPVPDLPAPIEVKETIVSAPIAAEAPKAEAASTTDVAVEVPAPVAAAK